MLPENKSDDIAPEPRVRADWTAPQITRMRAGDAENFLDDQSDALLTKS